MVFNKKGISPLIATVLIIGFTVALAAVIMVWGQGFIKGMQSKTQAGADVQLTCAQDVVLSVSDACYDAAGNLKITAKNDGSKDLKKITLRFYKSASDLTSYDLESGVAGTPVLGKHGVDTFTVAAADAGGADVKQVESLPIIEIDGKEQPCTQSGSKFPVGLLPETALGTCAA